MANAIGAVPGSGDGMGGKSLFLGVAILTLVALAGGGGVGYMLADETPAAPPADATDGTSAEPVAAEPSPARLLVPLAPVVTNLAAPASALLRVEASIVVDPDLVDDETVLAAQIGADTLAFLRSLELAQIEGARGLLHLREDLKERARLRSPAVEDYVIHALIAQ